MAVSDEWRWTDDQGVQRVVRVDELRSALASSVLAPSTLVWREGMTSWLPASSVPELGGVVAEASTTDIQAPLGADESTIEGRGAAPREPPRPPLVAPSRVVPNAPEPGSTADTGRPTPTELLQSGASQGASNGARGPRPAAGQLAQPASPARMGVAPAPRPVAVPAARPFTKTEVAPPRPGGGPTAPAWRKPQTGKGKSDEDVTLVAEAAEPFKLRSHGESAPSTAAAGGASSAAGAVAGGASAGGASAGGASAGGTSAGGTSTGGVSGRNGAGGAGSPGGAGASVAKRPVTRTALISPEQVQPKQPVARPASVPPPPQVPPRRPQSVPPPAVVPRPPSTAPPAGKAGSASPRVPAAPRLPDVPRSGFAIVENTSTDSTGVLPLRDKYAAEPAPERPPMSSYVDGAPPFAQRTPSFPDVPAAPQVVVTSASAGPPIETQIHPYSHDPGLPRPPMRSEHSPPRGPLPSSPSAAGAGQGAHTGGAGHSARPPPYSTPPPYSAPPPPLALGHPSMPDLRRDAPTTDPPPTAELRVTGALPLVHPKRSLTPPPNGASGLADAVDIPMEGLAPPGKASDPVIVPLSSLFGAGGILIAMAIAAFFIGRCSVAGGASNPPVRASLGALPRLAAVSMPPPPRACWVTKQPVRWAPAVQKSVPVDLAPYAGGVVVAYARDAREPATVQVDFGAGTFDDKPADKVEADIVRVFAPRDGGKLRLTTKGDGGPLAPYVFAPAAPPFVVGLLGRGTKSPAVAVADAPDAAPVSLWDVPAVDDEDAGLEAARALAVGPDRYAVVFRRGSSILGGFVGAGRKPEGGLGAVAGSPGGNIGKPAIGTNQREIAVVFADKATVEGAWEIRVGHAPLGQMPRETAVVPLPKGGPGGEAFAPDIAGIPDGRWVLVWTEGKSGGYAVRAQTFSADFKALGDPIAVSPPAGNYGQAVVGFAGGYVTTMFLSKGTTGSYELWGAVLQCGS